MTNQDQLIEQIVLEPEHHFVMLAIAIQTIVPRGDHRAELVHGPLEDRGKVPGAQLA